MPSVYIVHGGTEYRRLFTSHGWDIAGHAHQADLVQFTGGADVTPWLYGEKHHKLTGSDWQRDVQEMRFFGEALERGSPMAGICRGGQFLNVMCGGRMFQHVSGHASGATHRCLDLHEGYTFEATSTHHQMMRRAERGITVAVSAVRLSRDREDGYGVVDSMEREVEAVWYERQKCFCFQPHPEFHGSEALAQVYFGYLRKYLGVGA